ncbi:MAG: sigma factor-like helix-turn-helix DNA-binding protein, partial [Bacteroidota bacterium]
FLKQLPPKYQEALTATALEGVSQKELAEQLGISYSGAKSRVQRGKEKLKSLILACCKTETDRYGNLIEIQKKACDCP